MPKKEYDVTSTDLSDFGRSELEEASKLLDKYADNKFADPDKNFIKKIRSVFHEIKLAFTPMGEKMQMKAVPLYGKNELQQETKLGTTVQRNLAPNEINTQPDMTDVFLKSSYLQRLTYFKDTKTLNVYFWDEAPVQWFNVPQNIVDKIIAASDLAKTKGSNTHGQWWYGKHSVGATYIQELEQSGLYESQVLDRVVRQ